MNRRRTRQQANAKTRAKTKRPNPSIPFDPFDILRAVFGNAGIHFPPPPRFEDSFTREEEAFHELDQYTVDFQGMWKKIMMLCHPDKHQNSELSQEVTRWLIENRPK